MPRNDTERELREWRGSQSDAERLAGHILRFDGYEFVDPSHPLGGKDGLKDVRCQKDGNLWIGACYFPNSQLSAAKVKRKFSQDLKGVETNQAYGVAFVTNQEVSVAERKALAELAKAKQAEADIFHLERVVSILDSPQAYGTRLTYLGIEMSKEEQVAFFDSYQQGLAELQLEMINKVQSLEASLRSHKPPADVAAQIDQLKSSVASFFPDPMRLDSFSRYFGRNSLSITQLNQFSEQMEKLSGSLPVVERLLPQVIKIVSSLSKSNDPLQVRLTAYGLRSESQKFQDGLEVLAKLVALIDKK